MTNEDFEDTANMQRPADRFQVAAESLQFEAPDQAATKLRDAIALGFQDSEGKRKIEAERQAARQQVADFTKTRPHLAGNDMASSAITRQVLSEQIADLNGISDMAAWEKQLGRAPTMQELDHVWLTAKTNGAKVRSAGELLETATRKFEDTFGIQRKGTNPTQTIRDRQTADRKARGLAPLEYGDRSSDSDQHVATTISPSQVSTRGA
jgi:hypothetical protein